MKCTGWSYFHFVRAGGLISFLLHVAGSHAPDCGHDSREYGAPGQVRQVSVQKLLCCHKEAEGDFLRFVACAESESDDS